MSLTEAMIYAKTRGGLLFQRVGVALLQEGDDTEQILTGSYRPLVKADLKQ